MIRSHMFISPSCCSVYVRVPNPSSVWNKQTSVKHKKLAKKRKADHGTQRETPASAVYTNLEWKQYSSVILSGRCRSSVRARGAGARLPPQPLLWLAPPEWLLWSSAVQVTGGSGGSKPPSLSESQQVIPKEEAVPITFCSGTGGVGLMQNPVSFHPSCFNLGTKAARVKLKQAEIMSKGGRTELNFLSAWLEQE